MKCAMPAADLPGPSRVSDRVLRGIRWGLAAAACYVAGALFLFVTSGGAAFDERNASLSSVVVAYLLGGSAGAQ